MPVSVRYLIRSVTSQWPSCYPLRYQMHSLNSNRVILQCRFIAALSCFTEHLRLAWRRSTMTLLLHARSRIRSQVAYWILRSWPPADTVSHVNFDQWSGDMAVGSCGLEAILAWQGVSSARLWVQSSRKVGVRPLLMEPGTRLRHSWAAVTDHDVYAF